MDNLSYFLLEQHGGEKLSKRELAMFLEWMNYHNIAIFKIKFSEFLFWFSVYEQYLKLER